ncbi:hypothetical protein [uncultured Desulfovibrio sp.]|uniref:virion core protein, T7 gp14 family n=1 Tax=uncultured Desulfovibrio sp. TaxID=167968 RepID=UPI0025E6A2A8|nr:hypothetical protein [uncultured Desulfovibrio sp.]
MCSPMALGIASLAIGTGSAIAKGVAQQQYMTAQAEEYARVADLNNKAAVREYTEQSAAERVSQMQEQAQASRQAQEIQKDALQKKGTMLASTNATGGALNALMADYEREEAVRRDNIRQQYEMRAVGHELNLSAYKDRAQNRINSNRNFIGSQSAGMNALGTILGIGAAGLNAYGLYSDLDYRQRTGGAG